MKMKPLFFIILFISLSFLFSCKKNSQEIKILKKELKKCQNNLNDSLLKTTNNSLYEKNIQAITPFTITSETNRILKRRGYTNNLSIVFNINESYFSFDNKTITVKTPVSSNDFEHISTYDISFDDKKAILYVISNKKVTGILSEEMKYISNHTFSFNDVKKLDGTTFELEKSDSLFVAVLNDHFGAYSRNDIITTVKSFAKEYKTTGTIQCKDYKVFFPEPKEACGGVIIDL